MTAPEMMHPSEETLAAFMECRLEQVARKQVLQHLDMEDCGECREVLLLVAEVDEPIPIWKSRWIALVAAVAVVVLLIVFWPPPPSEVQRIAEATESLQFRISEARLSVDDPYKPTKVMRGPKKETEAASNLQFLEAASRLDGRSRGDAIDRLQAMAAVRLYLGDTDLALKSLEEALKLADEEKLAPKRKAAILNDLAVARFQSWAGADDRRNLIAALDTIERARALDVSPSIAWTRAVLLEEAVDQNDAALQAWQDYLRLDPASAWATEAQNHVAALEGSSR